MGISALKRRNKVHARDTPTAWPNCLCRAPSSERSSQLLCLLFASADGAGAV
jgi:hypothetical protein